MKFKKRFVKPKTRWVDGSKVALRESGSERSWWWGEMDSSGLRQDYRLAVANTVDAFSFNKRERILSQL